MNNILDFLEKSSNRFPEKTAFVDENGKISFRELEKRAKAIGSFLVDKIKPTDTVAFYMEKSILAVCGIFGVIYAGGCYSFLDLRQPKVRLNTVIDVLKPSVILTDEENYSGAMENIELSNSKIVKIEEIYEYGILSDRLSKVREQILDTDPVYVNFTSGSTGVPKGVVVTHRGVMNFIPEFVRIFGITDQDVVGNQAPFDFDVSVKDIYSGILTGATVVLIPRSYFTQIVKLMDYLIENKVTTLVWAVSALCFVSIMKGFRYAVPAAINKILFSGEVMPIKHLNAWKAYLPEATYVNLYGPTEITCNCTYHIVDRDYDLNESIPIGTAFPNEKVFLLDEQDRLIEGREEIGEICVGGSCLALGYYRDPEKTNQVFVQNPINDRFYERIYRTGDLGKYNEKNELCYLSRKDFQIKHLGHRIELGEIEKVTQSIDGVSRACCIYDLKKAKIHLFYTGWKEKMTLVGELENRLPHFMIPQKTIQLEEMPLNKNGKIDRNKLKEAAEIG